jgi:hypothetical protein
LSIQSDGKILGDLYHSQMALLETELHLNADGGLDTSFNPESVQMMMFMPYRSSRMAKSSLGRFII